MEAAITSTCIYIKVPNEHLPGLSKKLFNELLGPNSGQHILKYMGLKKKFCRKNVILGRENKCVSGLLGKFPYSLPGLVTCTCSNNFTGYRKAIERVAPNALKRDAAYLDFTHHFIPLTD